LLRPGDGKAEVAIFYRFLKAKPHLAKIVSVKTETKISRENANVGPAFSHYLNAVICGIPAYYWRLRDITSAFLNIPTNYWMPAA